MKKKIYWIALIVVLLDQMTKFWVSKALELGTSISIIPHFFSITLVKNTGGAWSFLSDQVLLLTLVSGGCLILFNWYLSKAEQYRKLEVISYGLLMGGILGNFIDRVVHSAVIDFLDFNLIGYRFPTFNIADIAIVIGVFLFFIDYIRSDVCGTHSK